MFEVLLYPAIASFFTALGMKILEYRKDKVATKSTEIDNKIKEAGYFQTLLDDLTRRLEESVIAIEKRDNMLKERDAKIDTLIETIEDLTGELRKYKQLNGKEH